jgi:transposase
VIRTLADEALAALYSESGRPSIPLNQLLPALLLQAFYTIRKRRAAAMPNVLPTRS